MSTQIFVEDIYKYCTDLSSWTQLDGTVKRSDFSLPTDHELVIKFNNTPNTQLADLNLSNYWVYAWNIGLNNTKNISWRTSSSNSTDNLTMDLNKDIEYKLRLENGVITLYCDNTQIYTHQTYVDTLGTGYIRLINTDRVQWIKVREL